MRMWRERVYTSGFQSNSIKTDDVYMCINDLMRKSFNNHTMIKGNSITIITPGLYLSDGNAAMNIPFLKQERITHVLNVAEGAGFNMVNSNESYYKNTGIIYKGIQAYDRPSFPLDIYFNESIQFIHNAIQSGGKVVVHCVMGVSRSATIVIAYLMYSKKWSVLKALEFVYRHRWVRPNDGFLRLLASFNSKITTY